MGAMVQASESSAADHLSFEESSIAGSGHFVLVLIILASFPLILRFTHLMPTDQMHAAVAGRFSPLLRFLLFVIVYLWFLFTITAVGVGAEGRAQRRELVGTRAARDSGFLKTIAVAILAFAAIAGIGIGFNIFSAQLGMGSSSNLQAMSPHTLPEALGFLAAVISAGFVEEFVFRGYIQRQLEAATKNVFLASLFQVILFTLVHFYQPAFRLIPVFLIGCVLTVIAKWRKSLVPGMIAHGAGDAMGSLINLLQLFVR